MDKVTFTKVGVRDMEAILADGIDNIIKTRKELEAVLAKLRELDVSEDLVTLIQISLLGFEAAEIYINEYNKGSYSDLEEFCANTVVPSKEEGIKALLQKLGINTELEVKELKQAIIDKSHAIYKAHFDKHGAA